MPALSPSASKLSAPELSSDEEEKAPSGPDHKAFVQACTTWRANKSDHVAAEKAEEANEAAVVHNEGFINENVANEVINNEVFDSAIDVGTRAPVETPPPQIHPPVLPYTDAFAKLFTVAGSHVDDMKAMEPARFWAAVVAYRNGQSTIIRYHHTGLTPTVAATTLGPRAPGSVLTRADGTTTSVTPVPAPRFLTSGLLAMPKNDLIRIAAAEKT
ncbi:hypothetical protein F5Y18DRAFT_431073 [Xylariaceae sp. FL1019]|nr:hypothetical protein F5Y18DRAFT_431073 [Xylariaceae sp. FL1019]